MYSVVRDVCEEGFDLIDAADAVFLDLPHPWKVVPHAKIALKVPYVSEEHFFTLVVTGTVLLTAYVKENPIT
jgi:tRNA A58 N-methylase Trm61